MLTDCSDFVPLTEKTCQQCRHCSEDGWYCMEWDEPICNFKQWRVCDRWTPRKDACLHPRGALFVEMNLEVLARVRRRG